MGNELQMEICGALREVVYQMLNCKKGKWGEKDVWLGRRIFAARREKWNRH